LFVVALLPLWPLGESEFARAPVILVQQGAPVLPTLTPGASTSTPNQRQGTGTTTTQPKQDCVYRVIDGRDVCFCRPAGSAGARRQSPDKMCSGG